MSFLEFGPQLRPASPRQNPFSDDNSSRTSGDNNNTAASFLLEPEGEADSSTSPRRHTLVPNGFECIAHPVFFGAEPFSPPPPPPPPPPPAALSANSLRRAARTPATPRLGDRPGRASTSTAVRASVSAWNEKDYGGLIEALGAEELEGSSNCDAGGGKHASGGDDATGAGSRLGDGSGDGGGAAARGRGRDEGGSGREVDVECPICLGRFERQVTLTSCLHTFCHTCILGWYEHTVAVALSRGGRSAFHRPELSPAAYGSSGGNSSGSGGDNGRANSSSSSSSRAPAPYRCPLCKVPGPYFLAVMPTPPAPSTAFRGSAAGRGKGKSKHTDKGKNKNKNKGNDRGKGSPKLTFKLLGVRTVLGGGGPTSGGMEVETASGDGGGGGIEGGTGARGAGYPTMVELRAAVRTQLAIAAAVSTLEQGGAVMGPRSGNGAVAVAVAAAGGGCEGGGRGEGGSEGKGEERRVRDYPGGGDEVGREESNVTLSRSLGSGDRRGDSNRRSACSGTDPGASCGNVANNLNTSSSSSGGGNDDISTNRNGYNNSESYSSASTYLTSADRKCRSGHRAEGRGDPGANAATLTDAAAAAVRTQARVQTQASSVSGGDKSSGGGSGRRDPHRSHRKWPGGVSSSLSPSDFASHCASALAGEGAGGGSGEGGHEKHHSSSGSSNNSAGRSRCAQPKSSGDSPRYDHHREKRRKRRRRNAEEVDRSGSACGGRRRHQRDGVESRQGMPDSDGFRGFRSSGRVVGSGSLPWEPGSMVAEDALAAIEAMLEREKASLRGRASEPSPSL